MKQSAAKLANEYKYSKSILNSRLHNSISIYYRLQDILVSICTICTVCTVCTVPSLERDSRQEIFMIRLITFISANRNKIASLTRSRYAALNSHQHQPSSDLPCITLSLYVFPTQSHPLSSNLQLSLSLPLSIMVSLQLPRCFPSCPSDCRNRHQ